MSSSELRVIGIIGAGKHEREMISIAHAMQGMFEPIILCIEDEEKKKAQAKMFEREPLIIKRLTEEVECYIDDDPPKDYCSPQVKHRLKKSGNNRKKKKRKKAKNGKSKN